METFRIIADGYIRLRVTLFLPDSQSPWLLLQITPATLMGELVDSWAVEGRTNVFGNVVQVTEMESETGVAGRSPSAAPHPPPLS